MMIARLCTVLSLLLFTLGAQALEETLSLPAVGDNSLRILSPTLLELVLINTKAPDPATLTNWNLVNTSYQLSAPSPSEFAITVNGQAITGHSVLGFKRRPLYAPLNYRDLRIQNQLYLQLPSPLADGQRVEVKNPSGKLWPATMPFVASADPLRSSPALHVNQEGYAPAFPKKAMVGYYLGSAGEMTIPTSQGFRILDANSGTTVFQGSLTPRLDVGYTYSPRPYQKVYVADFSSLTNPGLYRLVVPGLGASSSFRIEEGLMMNFLRSYALGIYHQRCGTNNELPFTRFTHDPCHTASAEIPVPQSSFAFTWNKIASYSADYTSNPRHTAPQLKDEASQLYPFVRTGKVDVSGGHHDAGDYSKYTINSAALVHYLMFIVDAFPEVAKLDNLGLPESGDGISDVLQEAKWEADFLAKMQDADGGFYFLVYPKTREYESNVLPDKGDSQVVWPKTTAVTAVSVAALAQCASSPLMKQKYPGAAAAYMQKAQLGWTFLTNAIARFGKDGSYQKITHYGDDFMHDDELAWAACEMYLATGNTNYQQKLFAWFPNPSDSATWRWSWWRVYASYGCAIRSYAFAARTGRLPLNKLDTNYLFRCETELKAAAQDALTRAQNTAYGTSFPQESKSYRTAGWYFSAERAFDIAVGYQLTPRADFLDALLSNVNYEAGCNPINICYITGMGWRRQRETVNQYAQNDRRVLPPSGIPLGNLQSGFSWTATYGSELNALTFPDDNASSAPYAPYDRWADTFNVQTEFITVDVARSLGTVGLLASLTSTRTQTWTSGNAQIPIPAEVMPNQPVTATLLAPGMDLSSARIVWEARDQDPVYGSSFTFTPRKSGAQWIEVEAQLTDGRRLMAAANFVATNQPTPTVAVMTSVNPASPTGPEPGVFTFTRTGDTSAAMFINYSLGGTAINGPDYSLSPYGASTSMTFPAGSNQINLVVLPMKKTNATEPKTVTVTLRPGSGYLLNSASNSVLDITAVSAPITIVRPSATNTVLTWTTTPGRVYQILYKDNLAAMTWQALTPELPATTSTLTWTDSGIPHPAQRFYRVIQVR